MDILFREKKLPKELSNFKMHIMLLIKEMEGGFSPDLVSNQIDKYCELMKSLYCFKCLLINNVLPICASYNSLRHIFHMGKILSTLKEHPERFVLFNNGITIVCKKVELKNSEYELENPQIVNGCQTCNMIYQAHQKGMDLKSVCLIAKIVGSNVEDVTQGIVRGANRPKKNIHIQIQKSCQIIWLIRMCFNKQIIFIIS